MRKDLVKICENEKYIYFYKQKNKIIYYRGEKHGGRIWKLQTISFNEFISNVQVFPKL